MKMTTTFAAAFLVLATTVYGAESATKHSIVEVKPSVSADPILTDQDIADVKVVTSQSNATLQITLNKDAAERFKTYTAAHVGEKLDILVDGQINSSPVIKTPIEGGHLEITMLRDAAARKLAKRLKKEEPSK